MLFYYSGCGNSRHVALNLAGQLGERVVFIPDALRSSSFRYELAPGERLGFVWPVYCWAPPELVLEFVSRLEVKGRPSYCYLVATCGDTAGMSEAIFRKALSRRGLKLDSAWCLIMPETYVNIKSMDLDSPEGALEKIRRADEALPAIAEAIKSSRHCSELPVGSFPRFKSYIVKPLFYAFLVKDKYFKVSDACTSCGLCARLCPLQNISMVQGRPKWNGNCTTCNSCYHHCPVRAISFGKATDGKGQYYFERMESASRHMRPL